MPQIHEDLINLIREAMRRGEIAAEEIVNARSKNEDVKKILRLRRHDSEEFAIQKSGNYLQVWSSTEPPKSLTMAKPAKYYSERDTRHSNLGVMPKLRGPDKSGKRPGAKAWMLYFNTSREVVRFLET